MNDMKKSINYEALLESFDFDQEKIKSYFNSLISSLQNEVFNIKNKQDLLFKDKYDSYNKELDILNEKKEQIIKTYLESYKDLNEKYNSDILSLDNKYFIDKNIILDKLDENNLKIKNIKDSLQMELYNLKKPYESKNSLIEKKIDEEYFNEADFIFQAKEKLLINKELYLNIAKHTNDLKKTINFFIELKKINTEKYENTSYQNLEDEFTNVSNLLIKNKSLDNFIDIETLNKNTDSILNSIYDRINKLENNNSSSDLINTNDTSFISDLENNIKYKSIIKSLNKISFNKHESESIYDSINNYFNDKEKLLLNNFKENSKEIFYSVITNINKEINNNKAFLENSIKDCNSFLTNIINEYSSFKNDTDSFNSFFNSVLKKLDTNEVDSKIKLLNQYISYIDILLEYSKKLDAIAFELLTTKEVLKLKLLDLKKQYLTIDNKTKIKEIEYDFNQRINETCFEIMVDIDKLNSNIYYLKDNLLLDKNIYQNDLLNDLYVIEIKKNIDLLSIDYIISSKKLESLKEIALQNDIYVKDINILSEKIDFQKETENIILEALNNKIEYDSLLSNYDNNISYLENDSEQKIRYLNDILEVERENFTSSKEKADIVTKSLNELVYPELIKSKSNSSKLIKLINDDFDKKIASIKENAKLASKYKETSLIAGKEIYNNALTKLNNYFKYSNTDGIDRSSSITLIMSNFKKYINSLNESLNVFNYKLVFNDKQFNKITSSYLNNIAFNENQFLSYHSFKKMYCNYYNEFKNYIKTYKIYSSKQLLNIEKKLNEKRNNKIAKIVLKNTINIDGYLDDLDKINNSKIKIENKFEDKVSEFKEIYLNTLDQIKDEYDKKIIELNDLKNKAIKNNEMFNENINKSINAIYLSKNQKVKEINKINSNDNVEQIDNSIVYLKNDISSKYNYLDTYIDNLKLEHNKKTDLLSKESNDLFNKYEKEKEKLLIERKRLISEKEHLKNQFLNKINKDSFEFKNNYQNRIELLNEEANNKMVDNELEYSKVLNESIESLKNNSINLLSLIKEETSKINILSDDLKNQSKNIITKMSNSGGNTNE